MGLAGSGDTSGVPPNWRRGQIGRTRTPPRHQPALTTLLGQESEGIRMSDTPMGRLIVP